MELIWILLSIPAILGVGFAADSLGILPPNRRKVVNAVAYYVALPALLFTSTAGRNLSEIVTVDLVLGVIIAMAVTMGAAWVVHRRASDPSVRSVAIVQSYHTNFGYLGVPLVAIIFGELATARAALILGVGSLIQISVTMTILSSINGADENVGYVRQVLVNPIMIAILLGFVASAFQVSVPETPTGILEFVGEFALPLALIVTGAALTIEAETIDYRTAGNVIWIKIILMPMVTFLAFLWLGADSTTIRAAVLMFAMPSAVSTYVFASELGGDRRIASINVFATTVVSTGTLFVVVWLLFALT